ncbi:Ankyrin repeats containing protein [Cardinium endosymbiont of Sogatella furcifera]|uniref:ankyrin repeat domain-containing protein n=1 Tax=Cardinium endosymbiont of Sogatella furcifera TaxID=650378 RepID=UPI000E0D6333|nr:ankyrin repeat domain-containing protein [Cardinium endosymbiont of Sogatella furcifera]AXI24572.1 Ankyrin repeats containing protein [Cardinium endosymbiont of Sogatella furcifera]
MKKYLILLPLITSCNGLGRSGMLGGETIQHGESEITNKEQDMDPDHIFTQPPLTIIYNLLNVSQNDLTLNIIIKNASAIQKALPRMMGKESIPHWFEEKFFEAVMKGVPCQDNPMDLLNAINSGSIPLVKTLLKLCSYSKDYINTSFNLKCDVNISTCKTDNDKLLFPLFLSIKKGFLKITEVLLDHGANVNASDNLGNNALFDAVALDNEEKAQKMVKILLKAGANIKANKNNETPIDVAERLGRQGIVALLEEALPN